MNWNTQPTYDSSNMIDYTVTNESLDGTYCAWDLTELVKEWYAEGTENRTVALVATAEASFTSSYCAVATFNAYSTTTPPVLIVAYRNNNGIEPYYTYATMGAAEAGTAYIADATGQLKIAKELVSYASTVNPFSLNLVYNSDYFISNSSTAYLVPEKLGLSMNVGHGWTLDVIQRVEAETISGIAYIKYTDGDGTVHYFAKDTTKDSTGTYYYDEDGLGLKIKATSSTVYTMSDESGNTWTFTSGYLTAVTDNNGNKYTINYSSGKITSITQTNDGQSTITVATFAYSGNQVSTITDAAGNVYTLGYTSNKLTSISKNGTVIANYAYSGYRVISMTDAESNYCLQYEYNETSGKVTKYYEYTNADENTGVTIEISYPSNSQTVYLDYGNDRTKDTNDDLETHYLFDYAGRTANAYTVDSSGNMIGASNAVYTGTTSTDRTNNRTARTASIGVAAQQLMVNTNFEDDTYPWTYYSNTSLSTENPRTGQKSLAGTMATATTWAYARRITSTLTENTTYTASAYVNTSALTSLSGKGIYLYVTDSSGNSWTGESINYISSEDVDDGWVRISVTFKTVNTANHYVYIYGYGGIGTFYVDDIQLEKGAAPSNQNMLINGGMNYSYAWGGSSVAYSSEERLDSTNTLKLTGSPTTDAYASQTVPVYLSGAETYVLSGWVKANAVPDNLNASGVSDEYDLYKQCGLRAIITYTDNTTENHYVPFNADLSDWQFTSLTIVPKQTTKTVKTIQVVCAYEKNANVAYFDNISLVREVAQTMKYDDNGNLTSVTTTGLATDTNTYSGADLIKTVTGGNGTYEYTYDTAHNLTEVTDGLVTQTMTYDTAGNALTTVLSNSAGTLTIGSSATYTNYNNLVQQVTDARGNSTAYTYGSALYKQLGIPNVVTDANNTAVTTQRNTTTGRVTNSYITSVVSLSHTYTRGMLTTLSRGGYYDSTGYTQTYNMAYDYFGNLTSMGVGSRTLATYTYASKNGLLTKQTYGNGATVGYSYDTLARVTDVYYNGSTTPSLEYTYNGEGNLHRLDDNDTGRSYLYTYDSIGRLMAMSEFAGSTRLLSSYYTYDTSNRLKRWDVTLPAGFGTTYEVYGYNSSTTDSIPDGALTTKSMFTFHWINYSYDSLERLSTRSIANTLSETYTYLAGANGGNTTTLVDTYKVTSLVSNATLRQYSYSYDAVGNITKVTGADGSYTEYTYDKQGQLLTATEKTSSGTETKTYTYTYDTYGNLRTATDGTTPHTYTYGDSSGWLDLLTAYDGNTITYDNSGNPTVYHDGTTFAWEKGKQLASMTRSGATTSFEYNADGLRIKKTNSDLSYTMYYWSGDKLVMEITYTSGDAVSYALKFSYDENGQPIGVSYYNGTTLYANYYYVRNLQGDVEAMYIVGTSTPSAVYEYDPWGKLLSVKNSSGTVITDTTHIAHRNPIRYRGYYYDTSSGFYYLQSRYYDPAIGRFINADGYASTGQGFLGFNMFAYCGNNPINRLDANGESWEDIWKWFEDTFGFGITRSDEYEMVNFTTIFGGYEAGESTSRTVYGDISKPVSFYFELASRWWRAWEYKVGIQANIGDGGISIAQGIGERSITVSYNNSSMEFTTGVNKVAVTTRTGVDFGAHTASHYDQLYIRTLPCATLVVTSYYAGGMLVGVAGAAMGALSQLSF